MNKVFVISTNRSDYGGLKYIIDELQKQNIDHEYIDYSYIQKESNITSAMVKLIRKFKSDIKEKQIKHLFIMGDRWETFLISMIANMRSIVTYHQGGGEVTKGAYDEKFRKSISQLADYHFVISKTCRWNLGDQGIFENVFVCGSPRLDNDKSELNKIKFKKKTGLVIYHPTTKNNNAYEEITEVIDSLRYFDMNYIILYPNLDKESHVIINEIEEFSLNENVKLKRHYPLEKFHDILNSVDVLIGNSSAGILEAASYYLPVVNIGDRQLDRECNNNVIHVPCDKHEIIKGIDSALTDWYKGYCQGVYNKFGDGNSSVEIVDILKGFL